jgi:CheY-like chemotaxis protein
MCVGQNRPNKILLVDSHDDLRESLSLLFLTLGHDCVGVSNAADALAHVRTREPDVILLETYDLNWRNFASEIGSALSHHQHKKISFASYASADEICQLYASGFSEVILKPATLDQLLRPLLK